MARPDKELQERHRNDLLQVLAYSTISASKRVVCCLAYPAAHRPGIHCSSDSALSTKPGPRRLPPGRSYSYRGTNGAQPRGYLPCIGVGVKCLAEMLSKY